MADPAPDQRGGRDELEELLDDVDILRARLVAPSAIDAAAIDAELNDLVARLRASEQKLKERKRLDIPRER